MVNEFDEAYSDDPAVYGEPYPALLERIGSRVPGRLLDLGCGQGRNAVALAGLGHQVTAVDASAVGVEQAVTDAAKNGDTVHGVVADLSDFTIDAVFEIVLIDMVLHALDDAARARLLSSARDRVAPGGLLFAVVPVRGELVDELVDCLEPWPVDVADIDHRLERGEHAGEYTFVSVVGHRPEERSRAQPAAES